MPEVIMRLTGEEGALVRSLLNVVEAQKQGEKGMREWKAAGDSVGQVMKGLEEGATKVGRSIADGLLPGLSRVKDVSSGVALAIETAFNAVEAQIEKTHQRAEKFHKELEDLISSAARAGKIALLPELEKQVDAIQSKEVSKDERRGMLSSVMAEMPRLNEKQLMDAITFGVRAKEGGLDGGTAAQVRGTLSEIFPNATREQLDKNAGKLANDRIAGDEIKALRRAAGGGKSLDEAAADVYGLRVSGESAKTSVSAVEQMTGLDPADIKAKKMIKDPAAQAEVKKLKALKDEFDDELQSLQIHKEELNKDDLSGYEKHKRKAMEDQRRAENKKIEGREGEIHRSMHNIESDISKLGEKEIEDPDAQRKREKLLYINDPNLTADQQFSRALQTAKENPWLVKPGQQRALANFGEARKGFESAPDLVATARSQKEALGGQSREFELNQEIKEAETAGSDIAFRKTHSVKNLEFEARSQRGRNALVGALGGAAGEKAAQVRDFDDMTHGGVNAAAQLSGGPLGPLMNVMKVLTDHAEKTADNTEKRRPAVLRDSGNERGDNR